MHNRYISPYANAQADLLAYRRFFSSGQGRELRRFFVWEVNVAEGAVFGQAWSEVFENCGISSQPLLDQASADKKATAGDPIWKFQRGVAAHIEGSCYCWAGKVAVFDGFQQFGEFLTKIAWK